MKVQFEVFLEGESSRTEPPTYQGSLHIVLDEHKRATFRLHFQPDKKSRDNRGWSLFSLYGKTPDFLVVSTTDDQKGFAIPPGTPGRIELLNAIQTAAMKAYQAVFSSEYTNGNGQLEGLLRSFKTT